MSIFFDGWQGVIRILVSAPVIYIAIIVFIRFSGKRSTSQMNNFDWIVTVALGSLVGSGIILKDITVIDCLTAVGMLLLLQWVLTKWIFHSDEVANIVKAEPVLLVADGQLLNSSMRRERVTKSEIFSAVRNAGYVDLRDVRWVILETDATMNVVPVDTLEGDPPEEIQSMKGYGAGAPD